MPQLMKYPALEEIDILGKYSRLQAYIHNHRIVTDQSCGSIVIINKSPWLYVRWTMGVITTHNPTIMNRGTLVSVSFS